MRLHLHPQNHQKFPDVGVVYDPLVIVNIHYVRLILYDRIFYLLSFLILEMSPIFSSRWDLYIILNNLFPGRCEY